MSASFTLDFNGYYGSSFMKAMRGTGVSNFEIHHLKHLLQHVRVPPCVNQIEVHPRYQQVSSDIVPLSVKSL